MSNKGLEEYKEYKIKRDTEIWYAVEKVDGRVKIKCNSFDEMVEVAQNYKDQDIDFNIFKVTKEPAFFENDELS